MTDFTGKYKLESSENFDNFLKELGVGWVLRNLARTATPVIDIAKRGDEYHIKTFTAIKNSEMKFKLGEAFDEERLDGKRVKTKITADGNKLIQIQYDTNEVNIVREFSGTELKAIATCNGVTSVRVYRKQTK